MIQSILLRGGACDDYYRNCRSACRDRIEDLIEPDYAYYDVGFRVVCLPLLHGNNDA